jgi:predicted signal transduction protein with EAL and GGDEF domain
VTVSARVGVAVFPADGSDADTLFRNAEAALKRAKATGERYLFYAREMTERVAERLSLESKLRKALEREEFVLHYQPKIRLDRMDIVGVEALIRWRSPDLGLVPPMKFVPLLEETGLILQVGAWALARAVLDHRAWVGAGLGLHGSPSTCLRRSSGSAISLPWWSRRSCTGGIRRSSTSRSRRA